MAAELTPDFVAANGLPDDAEGQAAEVARWHRRKTEIYTAMVAAGALPPRPGITRIITEAQDAGWTLAVASTSAEPSVRAILEHAVGAERAAGSTWSWPATSCRRRSRHRTSTCSRSSGSALPPADVLVIEDSRNGLLAATGAGLRCVMTVNGYTEKEDSSEAVLVVSLARRPRTASRPA